MMKLETVKCPGKKITADGFYLFNEEGKLVCCLGRLRKYVELPDSFNTIWFTVYDNPGPKRLKLIGRYDATSFLSIEVNEYGNFEDVTLFARLTLTRLQIDSRPLYLLVEYD